MTDDKDDELFGEILAPEGLHGMTKFRYKRIREPILKRGDPETYRKIGTLASLQCTQREAAGFLGVGAGTLEEFIQKDPEAKLAWWEGRQNGRVSLRRLLWIQAQEDSKVAMFLAKDKRWLDMEKKVDHITNNNTLIMTDEDNKARITELLQLAKGKK